MCAALDAEVEAFRSRPLLGDIYPYLWLDATYLKVREAARVVSMAALVAIQHTSRCMPSRSIPTEALSCSWHMRRVGSFSSAWMTTSRMEQATLEG